MMILGKIIEIEGRADIKERFSRQSSGIEVLGLAVHQEGVSVLSSACRGQRFVDDDGGGILSLDTHWLRIADGPVVEVDLSWAAILRHIGIDQEVDVLGRIWIVLELPSEAERWRIDGLGGGKVCAYNDGDMSVFAQATQSSALVEII